MGQYFLAVCPERLEYLSPRSFGAGVKAGEILFSSAGQMDAFAMLIADPGVGARPADLRVPGVTGSWAGTSAFYIGDYAEDGDAPRWPWAIGEGQFYHGIQENGREVSGRLVRPVARTHGLFVTSSETTIRFQSGEVEKYKNIEFLDLRPAGDGLRIPIEAYGGNRHYEEMARKAAPKVAREKPSSYLLDARDGARRLVANLDRREYIDPRQLAEIPTLAGIMRGNAKVWRADPPLAESDPAPPSTLQIMSSALFARGVDESCHGGWRTDRVLITAERSRRFPTTGQIEADPDWTDVTQHLVAIYRSMVSDRDQNGRTCEKRTPDWGRFHGSVDSWRHTWGMQ